MKKYFLILLLFAGMTNAQNVFISDDSFRQKLIGLGIDANFDQQIQQSEALTLTTLDLMSSGISDLTGIEAFTNLQTLNCSYNTIVSINLSTLTNLTELNCESNDITSIDLSALTSLVTFNCRHNELLSLTVTNPNLQTLICESNFLQTLNIAQATALQTLYCSHNNIMGLNLAGLNNLQLVECNSNLIPSLNLSGLNNLTSLYCDYNLLTTLSIDGLSNLRTLYCMGNDITSLSMNGITDLRVLRCEFNQLTTLDLSGNTSNDLFVDCSSNNLSTLFIKNGWNVTLAGTNCQCSGNITFQNNPNLAYVCCDNGEIADIQALSGTENYSNFTANSYCSFVPGGSYNTITGNIKFDADGNGCDNNDIVPLNVRVNISDGSNPGATFTNSTGNYTFHTQAGNFVIDTAVENPTWFNFSPATATIPFADNSNNTAMQDFCVTAAGLHHDVEMMISPVTPARPGFDAVYKISYKNLGNQTESFLALNLAFEGNVLDFLSASVTPVSTGSNNILWNIPNVRPFESGSFDVTFHVNSPVDVPPVFNGDILTFDTYVDITIDENLANNAFTFHQNVTGSFDPNDIICLEGDVVSSTEIGHYLHYTINFENTGTYPAENIVVATQVDASKFDINSLQLITATAGIDVRITGNKAEFIFDDIQLPIGGHGHILLKIKTRDNLVIGDAVAKRADIFFDYNAPIDTGFANTVFQTLSNSQFDVDGSVVVSPNPASTEVMVKADNAIQSISLFDVQGRVLNTQLLNDMESRLDVAMYPNGVYFIKITTEKGIKVQKIIKE